MHWGAVLAYAVLRRAAQSILFAAKVQQSARHTSWLTSDQGRTLRTPPGPQGLSNTVWALGKLGVKLTFEIRQLVDACCLEIYNQLAHQRYKGTYAPQNISNTVIGLAKLGYIPTQVRWAGLDGVGWAAAWYCQVLRST